MWWGAETKSAVGDNGERGYVVELGDGRGYGLATGADGAWSKVMLLQHPLHSGLSEARARGDGDLDVLG